MAAASRLFPLLLVMCILIKRSGSLVPHLILRRTFGAFPLVSRQFGRKQQMRFPTRMLSSPSAPSSDERKQTVAVVGSGAIGSYYGARLWEGGHDVKFHMRGEHLSASQLNGLEVSSIDGNLLIPPEELRAFESTQDIGNVDWVLVCLKTSSLEAIPELIGPLLDSDRTRVVLAMNGLQLEEDLTEMVKRESSKDESFCKALYGGMAFICSNRIAPGKIDHTFAGLLAAGLHVGDNVEEDQVAFEKLWETTKIPINYEPSLLRGRWKKMLWNLPFNGISVAMGGITVDKIVETPSLRALAFLIMDETVAIANKDMELHCGSGNYEPFTEDDKQYMMGLSDKIGAYKTSTMLDLTNRRSMEVKYLFQTPLARAEALGIEAPRLATLVAQIEGFQRMYELY